MKRSIVILFATLALLLNACSYNPFPGAIQGSGRVISESRPVSNFTRVVVNGGAEAQIIQGDSESVTIEAEDNILPLITSNVIDGTLTLELRMRGNSTSLTTTRPIRFKITVKNLNALERNGSGNTDVGNIQTDALTLTAHGAGNIILASLQASQLSVMNDGTGDVSVNSGKIDRQTISISSSGKFSAANLESQSAEVKSDGSSSATIWVKSSLQVTIFGSGSITYYGAPQITQNITGSGSVNGRGIK